jgi:hypothetical protein
VKIPKTKKLRDCTVCNYVSLFDSSGVEFLCMHAWLRGNENGNGNGKGKGKGGERIEFP